jgi:hypothetical protein
MSDQRRGKAKKASNATCDRLEGGHAAELALEAEHEALPAVHLLDEVEYDDVAPVDTLVRVRDVAIVAGRGCARWRGRMDVHRVVRGAGLRQR